MALAFDIARVLAIIAFSCAAGLLPAALAGRQLTRHPQPRFDPRDYPKKSALWKGAGLVQQSRQQWAVRRYPQFIRVIRWLIAAGLVAVVVAILTAGN